MGTRQAVVEPGIPLRIFVQTEGSLQHAWPSSSVALSDGLWPASFASGALTEKDGCVLMMPGTVIPNVRGATRGVVAPTTP